MLLKPLFLALMTLYAVYCTFCLPMLYLYIGHKTSYLDVKSDEDYLLVMLRIILLLIPGVALVKAYKVYKDCNRKIWED